MNMRLSVVIPAHNEERYIEKCLLALEEQKDSSTEIIVVNNASTDSTGEIAQVYADKVVWEPKKGVAIARQRGLMEASGKVVAFTDADTVVGENWIECIKQEFSNSHQAIYGPVYLLDGKPAERLIAKYGFTAFLQLTHILGIPNVCGQNFAARRDLLLNIGGFNTSLLSAEDVELGRRINRVAKLRFVPQMEVYTSARRLRAGYLKFLSHHTANFISMLISKRGRAFEDVRL